MIHSRLLGGCAAALWLLCSAAQAQDVALAGLMGSKALLVVNGGAPRALAPGESLQGVKLLSVSPDGAVVEREGKRHTLHLGEMPVRLASPASAPPLVLRADARGHFIERGYINGQPMQYLVDTGASAVALDQTLARRIGIRPEQGQPTRIGTANGTATGWRITLDTVRVGNLELRGVDAIITSEPMPFVLLGNSFLRFFEMKRSGNELILQPRS